VAPTIPKPAIVIAHVIGSGAALGLSMMSPVV
jgi:hypothetical protein